MKEKGKARAMKSGRKTASAKRRGIRLFRALIQLSFLASFILMAWAASYPPSGNYPDNLFLRAEPVSALLTLPRTLSLSLALPALILILLTVVSGRFFCGWICPLGTCFDFTPSAGRLGKRASAKVLPRGLSGKQAAEGAARVRLKYVLLAAVAALYLAGVGLLWLLEPVVIANRAVIFILSGSVPFIFLVLLTLAALYRPRFWCQELCPTGALFSAVSSLGKRLPERVSPLALRKNEEACIHCGRCALACPFEITAVADSRKSGRLDLADCALCGDCVAACPRPGALALTSFGRAFFASGGRSGKEDRRSGDPGERGDEGLD